MSYENVHCIGRGCLCYIFSAIHCVEEIPQRGWKLSHGGTTAYLYGISQEVAKKRTRRTVKSQRAIVGASLDVIKERRAQRPEARAAARQAAIKEGKERKSAQESKKKQEKAKSAAGAARGQTRGGIASKQQAKGAPAKVTAKSR